jgi:hypothetical protein
MRSHHEINLTAIPLLIPKPVPYKKKNPQYSLQNEEAKIKD